MDASEHLTIEDVLSKSSDYLARHQVTNFKTDAEWLIAHALGWPRMQLYLKFNEVLSDSSLNSIKKFLPLQCADVNQIQFKFGSMSIKKVVNSTKYKHCIINGKKESGLILFTIL